MAFGLGGAEGVVAEDEDFPPGLKLPDPLDQVVGEAVVVVDHQDHAGIVPAGGIAGQAAGADALSASNTPFRPAGVV